MLAVVDNEIRWSNLANVKEDWEDRPETKKGSKAAESQKGNEDEIQPYRVCRRSWCCAGGHIADAS